MCYIIVMRTRSAIYFFSASWVWFRLTKIINNSKSNYKIQLIWTEIDIIKTMPTTTSAVYDTYYFVILFLAIKLVKK